MHAKAYPPKSNGRYPLVWAVALTIMAAGLPVAATGTENSKLFSPALNPPPVPSQLPAPTALTRIRISSGADYFLRGTNRFVPWGFNYDHDDDGTLLEDYWEQDWSRVEADFREMKALGANLIRIHLQLGKFMSALDRPNTGSLNKLSELLLLAERCGLYLDLTGLGCYHRDDVPAWYDALDEEQRWAVQARFWQEIARRGRTSTAVFCYDLMNEPVVPGSGDVRRDWLGPPFAGKHFVQFISRDLRGRARPAVARAWVRHLTKAIRTEDPATLITVGLVDWSLDRPGLSSGFVPAVIAPELDFMSVHLYPETGRLDEQKAILKGFAVGKPVLIEETFPLKCSFPDFARFIAQSRDVAAGWLGFYWGKTVEEHQTGKTIKDALMTQWLTFFARGPEANNASGRTDD